MTLIKLGAQAKEAATALAQASTITKNTLLFQMADALDANISDILSANQKDLDQAVKNHLDKTMIDRLTLTEERINAMADGIRQVATLPDPIGLVDKMWVNEDGLQIGKRRVPLGVIGIIYEARPNVTTDAAALCFKSGNAVILRGGKAAFYSSQLLVQLLSSVLEESSLPTTCIQFIEDTSREVAKELMQLNDYLDVLIPRGGASLIKTVVETATVPVIETGTGNCHIFVDQTADFDKAKAIIVNAKCQRPSVCNAAETLIIHEAIAERFLPLVEAELANYQVELRADETAYPYLNNATKATPEDWQTEFLDLILAVKIVPSTAAAIEHINKYSTKHSEAIISNDYTNTQSFLNEVDSAAVYVNASTRYTDGFAFGFGAEIGISTQKLHARGPMGLPELTTTKYIVYGEGQIRS